MRFLGREQITVTPQTRSESGGRYSLTPGTPFVIWGSVQPVGQRLLDRLPEGARMTARWIIYCEGPDAPFSLAPPAPRLTTSKGTLVPVAEIDLTTHTTGLPHVGVVCAEVGADE